MIEYNKTNPKETLLDLIYLINEQQNHIDRLENIVKDLDKQIARLEYEIHRINKKI